MPYTFVNNGGSSSSVSTATLGAGAVLTRYDEAGLATTNTVNVANYDVNNVIIPNGTGGNDSVVGSAVNDLFIWDDFALSSGAPRTTANGASQYGWDRSSSNRHIEDWFGGAGNDIFAFTSISGNTALARAVTIYGGIGNDIAWTDSGNDQVFGDDGADTVYGAAGDDVLAGDSSLSTTTSGAGDGTDFLYGGSGTDTIYGAGGNDIAFGGADVDTVYGGDGNDTLQGDAANDRLFGDAGNDTLDGGAGADALDGGAGIDYASYASAAAAVTVDLGNVAANTGDAAGDTYTDIEGYICSNFNDTFFGSSAGDLEYGGLGDDHLQGGGGGADTLYGGDGNDFLTGMYAYGGGGLPDTLYGDAGDDTLLFSNEGANAPAVGTFYAWTGETGAASIITLTGAGYQDTTDRLYGGAGFDTVDASRGSELATPSTQQQLIRAGKDVNLDWIMSAEYFIASNNNDIVSLSYSDGTTVNQSAITDNVTVTGREGNDTIISGAGNDVLVGGSMTAAAPTGGAADTIWGGDGNDQIWGDDFGDSITGTGGEGGIDTLYGADGDDTVFSQGGSDLSYGGLGNDVIWSDQSDWGLTTSSVMGNDTIYGGDGDDFILDLGGRNSLSVTTSNDLVYGGLGNDVISVFAGNDVIDAGDGADAVWAGPGNDTVYGGIASDYIYGGAGTDTLYGGAGEDFYYFSRTDGLQTVVEVSGEGAINHLVIFGTFWETADNSTPPQLLTIGSGIRETDVGELLTVGHVLGNHSDTAAQTGNVNVTYNLPTSITVSVAGSSGSITFNPLLFADITLWNHDATIPNQIQELYTWDPNARGAGLGGFEFVAYIG